MDENDLYFLECLPDTLAEALEVIRSIPKEKIPRRDLIAEYALEVAKECVEN